MLTNDAYLDQIGGAMREHEQLRQVVDRIHGLLAEPCEDGGTLRIGFVELEQHLVTHFAHEESGGYFAEVVQIAPRFKGEIDGLQRQHPVLLKMMVGLIQKAGEAPLTKDRWQRIANGFEQFVEHFIEHETDENDLLQQAYCQDIGAED